MSESGSPAVFMDRDGTLIKDKHYLDDPDEVEWIPGTFEALKLLNQTPLKLIMVTNQSGVGRGYMDRSDVEAVHEQMSSDLSVHDLTFDMVLYEPYIDGSDVDVEMDYHRRKPRPGMLEEARDKLDINTDQSFMIGDKLSDLRAGWAVGCTSILVRTGNGKQTEAEADDTGIDLDRVEDRFAGAVEWIVNRTGRAG